MMNIIYLAPPAAGKGTISRMLVDKFDYQHISTGDLLRNEIKCGTELGQKLNEIMAKGMFIPDDYIVKLIKQVLTSAKPFILDGFPRNIEQAKILDELFDSLEIDNYVAIYLDIDKDEAKKRSTGRQVCSRCNLSYHKYNGPQMPKVVDICDRCNGDLTQRPDDAEETFLKRYDIFMKSTYPLVDYYKEKGKLTILDSNKGSEWVVEETSKIIKEA